MKLTIRKLEARDVERLEAFFAAIPEDDRTFFKEDLSTPEAITALAIDRRGLRLIAIDEANEIAGYVAVLPETGLSRHVGEVRLVVSPTRRRSGAGKALARRALFDSVRELGLRKLCVEVMAAQEPAIAMFRQIGFEGEAILRDHLRDRSGAMQDLILLSHFVEDNWDQLRTLGLDREVG